MDHVSLIIKGSEFHEALHYEKGLEQYQLAYDEAPNCPASMYYLANALFMLDREAQAKELLEKLIAIDDNDIENACETPHPEVLSYKVDGYYLMFHVMLHFTDSWKDAYPYAQLHLDNRQIGVTYNWTKKHIKLEMAELRREFKN